MYMSTCFRYNKRKLLAVLSVVFATIAIFTAGYFGGEHHVCNIQQITSTYRNWKMAYLRAANSQMSRVIDPEMGNVTVSEGIGYGMLFSVAQDDPSVFKCLWKYAQYYMDDNGLMNWKIDADGNVIGTGAASDADEDMAYALLLASKKWKNPSYLKNAQTLVKSIQMHEIDSRYVLLPGDKWRVNPPLNPSYISPQYYKVFEKFDYTFWDKVYNVNFEILISSADRQTGLFPDWINYDRSLNSDNSNYGYDAIRVPIRLLYTYQAEKDSQSATLLAKIYNYVSNKSSLVAGYSLNGNPLVRYLNTSYLASYAAVASYNNQTAFIRKCWKN
ncbi:glycosyl hydrolase family 8 [Ethanoligenens harbinense]|uniref:Glucanase n=1 Tax=Ethanoligenens harbinense (strain DSM 18485 / JCM 12961 / CGMCC 1.5033 / YUAN-3) TaxID=663278 RepID=E6U3F5_ETHHY|nr:glycosyl hydrolase family 8 [Ethanoligenens harbinense]ADU26447.1 glycoside hydrolase family 8 [Ethanoligenens harbinense YUAN-3]AVQ95573.1 hypothetical protein CXQ68_04585 [Ethanoligenens harbinense YUAN-3]AYF38237.1 hypothetical protein CXP51_04445 [Ethanoligenens harbinense]AYF40983.1 hypothetical protein CN246_04580 [Ethanoligenens harbinense]QCN91814.1 hypothetical protein DRA42_04595 [Ethanoligenens harbinense]